MLGLRLAPDGPKRFLQEVPRLRDHDGVLVTRRAVSSAQRPVDGPGRRGRIQRFSGSQRQRRSSDRGLTIVYYGDGKGKTTAALGAVLRAVGQGWRCAVIQFIKGSWPSSERVAIPRYLRDLVTIEAGGRGFVGIVDDRLPRSAHKKQARELFQKVQRMFKGWRGGVGSRYGAGGKQRAHLLPTAYGPLPQLVVLDEILDVVEFGFLSEAEVVRLIKARPVHMHLILTGHKKFPKVLATADLVTRMAKEKHPYDQGFLAVRGVDY